MELHKKWYPYEIPEAAKPVIRIDLLSKAGGLYGGLTVTREELHDMLAELDRKEEEMK